MDELNFCKGEKDLAWIEIDQLKVKVDQLKAEASNNYISSINFFLNSKGFHKDLKKFSNVAMKMGYTIVMDNILDDFSKVDLDISENPYYNKKAIGKNYQ
ncbi:hypothetical protein ACH5RR_041145 [Cinchona calisaya]|uniref:Uncharacterized protein n=1 Tax=Cinchona calisaya TaxID=153742 RepID=A0ABD2XU57_9GENT